MNQPSSQPPQPSNGVRSWDSQGVGGVPPLPFPGWVTHPGQYGPFGRDGPMPPPHSFPPQMPMNGGMGHPGAMRPPFSRTGSENGLGGPRAQSPPAVNMRPWTPAEDERLHELVQQYSGGHWNSVAAYFEGRMAAECMNRWHKHLKLVDRRTDPKGAAPRPTDAPERPSASAAAAPLELDAQHSAGLMGPCGMMYGQRYGPGSSDANFNGYWSNGMSVAPPATNGPYLAQGPPGWIGQGGPFPPPPSSVFPPRGPPHPSRPADHNGGGGGEAVSPTSASNTNKRDDSSLTPSPHPSRPLGREGGPFAYGLSFDLPGQSNAEVRPEAAGEGGGGSNGESKTRRGKKRRKEEEAQEGETDQQRGVPAPLPLPTFPGFLEHSPSSLLTLMDSTTCGNAPTMPLDYSSISLPAPSTKSLFTLPNPAILKPLDEEQPDPLAATATAASVKRKGHQPKAKAKGGAAAKRKGRRKRASKKEEREDEEVDMDELAAQEDSDDEPLAAPTRRGRGKGKGRGRKRPSRQKASESPPECEQEAAETPVADPSQEDVIRIGQELRRLSEQLLACRGVSALSDEQRQMLNFHLTHTHAADGQKHDSGDGQPVQKRRKSAGLECHPGLYMGEPNAAPPASTSPWRGLVASQQDADSSLPKASPAADHLGGAGDGSGHGGEEEEEEEGMDGMEGNEEGAVANDDAEWVKWIHPSAAAAPPSNNPSSRPSSAMAVRLAVRGGPWQPFFDPTHMEEEEEEERDNPQRLFLDFNDERLLQPSAGDGFVREDDPMDIGQVALPPKVPSFSGLQVHRPASSFVGRPSPSSSFIGNRSVSMSSANVAPDNMGRPRPSNSPEPEPPVVPSPPSEVPEGLLGPDDGSDRGGARRADPGADGRAAGKQEGERGRETAVSRPPAPHASSMDPQASLCQLLEYQQLDRARLMQYQSLPSMMPMRMGSAIYSMHGSDMHAGVPQLHHRSFTAPELPSEPPVASQTTPPDSGQVQLQSLLQQRSELEERITQQRQQNLTYPPSSPLPFSYPATTSQSDRPATDADAVIPRLSEALRSVQWQIANLRASLGNQPPNHGSGSGVAAGPQPSENHTSPRSGIPGAPPSSPSDVMARGPQQHPTQPAGGLSLSPSVRPPPQLNLAGSGGYPPPFQYGGRGNQFSPYLPPSGVPHTPPMGASQPPHHPWNGHQFNNPPCQPPWPMQPPQPPPVMMGSPALSPSAAAAASEQAAADNGLLSPRVSVRGGSRPPSTDGRQQDSGSGSGSGSGEGRGVKRDVSQPIKDEKQAAGDGDGEKGGKGGVRQQGKEGKMSRAALFDGPFPIKSQFLSMSPGELEIQERLTTIKELWQGKTTFTSTTKNKRSEPPKDKPAPPTHSSAPVPAAASTDAASSTDPPQSADPPPLTRPLSADKASSPSAAPRSPLLACPGSAPDIMVSRSSSNPPLMPSVPEDAEVKGEDQEDLPVPHSPPPPVGASGPMRPLTAPPPLVWGTGRLATVGRPPALAMPKWQQDKLQQQQQQQQQPQPRAEEAPIGDDSGKGSSTSAPEAERGPNGLPKAPTEILAASLTEFDPYKHLNLPQERMPKPDLVPGKEVIVSSAPPTARPPFGSSMPFQGQFTMPLAAAGSPPLVNAALGLARQLEAKGLGGQQGGGGNRRREENPIAPSQPSSVGPLTFSPSNPAATSRFPVYNYAYRPPLTPPFAYRFGPVPPLSFMYNVGIPPPRYTHMHSSNTAVETQSQASSEGRAVSGRAASEGRPARQEAKVAGDVPPKGDSLMSGSGRGKVLWFGDPTPTPALKQQLALLREAHQEKMRGGEDKDREEGEGKPEGDDSMQG
ncbi:unnamed protein product [Vitrella brassicaformis CCMP3155]|uniref:Uncharacterized protein n=4 Tax=Vitrella brassicaformis TaxID=1169539 RepID=A0A0G4G4C5_VITBC|nr:unnamed protein product [Vitrella brassicaformis CCMP3155]|eukprot:CEM22774.1 unnamed protein product [Vitrella brassicaformis CCMP3155]